MSSESRLKRAFKSLIKRKPKQVAYRPKRKVTLSDVLDFIAIAYFGHIAEKFAKTFDLEKQLAQAGLQTYPTLYAARGLLYIFASIFFSIYIAILVAVSPFTLAIKIISVIILMLVPIFVLAGVLVYPAAKREERKNNVETELPFFAAYLTTMARAGVSIANVVERVSTLKIFKAIREEASMILRDMRLLGKSPLDAIEENALFHPSPLYRDFMLGYVTSVKTGGDVLHYLEIRTQDIFNNRMNQMKLIAERMSMFTEIYVTLAVIMTLV
ncbi:MAG: type II secretion system F family protein, partial [Desulfurococcales archaeon]|nr:type II secretion system F family protein [Desulfurococcales archaeon]